MFLLINQSNREKFRWEISSMHRLRYRIFVEELKWNSPSIQVVDGMEFDQFDLESAHYIVRLNEEGEVDACTRLLPTDGPYLLGDVFPDLVEVMPIPHNNHTWETSRFCADRRTAPKNIVGLLVAAMLEFGLSVDMQNYVSISDIRIEPLLKRHGWNPVRLGEPKFTGTDYAAGEIFEVSMEALNSVRAKSGITHPLLFNESLPEWQRLAA